MRSMSSRQARNASARWGALAAQATAASPTRRAPIRCVAATRTPGISAAISPRMRPSSASAIAP